MSAERRSYLYVAGGVSGVLIFALAVQGFLPNPDVSYDSSLNILSVPAGAERYPASNSSCSPKFSPVLDESSRVKYQIRTPHILPEGYSLQGIDVTDERGIEMVTLYYWNKPLCNIEEVAGSAALNGAVVIHIAKSMRVPESHAQIINAVNKEVPEHNIHHMEVNGSTAIGYDPSSGLSVNAVNGKDPFPYPARIFFVNNKILYHLEANMPLEDLARIAESIG
jgi:hypothetical protein